MLSLSAHARATLVTRHGRVAFDFYLFGTKVEDMQKANPVTPHPLRVLAVARVGPHAPAVSGVICSSFSRPSVDSGIHKLHSREPDRCSRHYLPISPFILPSLFTDFFG